jgi:hypothetical protein
MLWWAVIGIAGFGVSVAGLAAIHFYSPFFTAWLPDTEIVVVVALLAGLLLAMVGLTLRSQLLVIPDPVRRRSVLIYVPAEVATGGLLGFAMAIGLFGSDAFVDVDLSGEPIWLASGKVDLVSPQDGVVGSAKVDAGRARVGFDRELVGTAVNVEFSGPSAEGSALGFELANRAVVKVPTQPCWESGSAPIDMVVSVPAGCAVTTKKGVYDGRSATPVVGRVCRSADPACPGQPWPVWHSESSWSVWAYGKVGLSARVVKVLGTTTPNTFGRLVGDSNPYTLLSPDAIEGSISHIALAACSDVRLPIPDDMKLPVPRDVVLWLAQSGDANGSCADEAFEQVWKARGCVAWGLLGEVDWTKMNARCPCAINSIGRITRTCTSKLHKLLSPAPKIHQSDQWLKCHGIDWECTW